MNLKEVYGFPDYGLYMIWLQPPGSQCIIETYTRPHKKNRHYGRGCSNRWLDVSWEQRWVRPWVAGATWRRCTCRCALGEGPCKSRPPQPVSYSISAAKIALWFWCLEGFRGTKNCNISYRAICKRKVMEVEKWVVENNRVNLKKKEKKPED